MKTPPVWMEARCGSVCSDMGENWKRPPNCQETAEGGFFSNVLAARKQFVSLRWRIMDGEWFCPACVAKLRDR